MHNCKVVSEMQFVVQYKAMNGAMLDQRSWELLQEVVFSIGYNEQAKFDLPQSSVRNVAEIGRLQSNVRNVITVWKSMNVKMDYIRVDTTNTGKEYMQRLSAEDTT